MDKFKLDSHKLMYHLDRLCDWQRGKNIYPIYLEIAPSGSCNHRCTYCGLDFMLYRQKFIDKDILKKRLSQLPEGTVKSIMYAGEGEPLLHKDIAQIIEDTRQCGIDVAITTNGVLLKEKLIEKILAYTTWIKVSVDAATAKTYARIHRANPCDFKTVIKNLSSAVKIKKKNAYKCTLGMQLVLLPENSKEILHLAQKAKNLGLDYLAIKPYSQHPLSITTRYKNIKYRSYFNLFDKLARFNSENFSVIFRLHTMEKWEKPERNYKHCLAIPFWAYIDAGGNVWGCSMYLTKDKFRLGNIYQQELGQIFESQKRKKLLNWAQTRLDTSFCRVNCRMDEINRYLWELKNPPEHMNFI